MYSLAAFSNASAPKALPMVVEPPPPYEGAGMFESGSNLLLDLKSAVLSVKYRMIENASLNFSTAFENVLNDIYWKQRNPNNKPSGL